MTILPLIFDVIFTMYFVYFPWITTMLKFLKVFPMFTKILENTELPFDFD